MPEPELKRAQAVEREAPLICFAAAGGARMQEGALSLMQMPRTTLAIQMLKEAGLPYVVVLTDPTTGGVTVQGTVRMGSPGHQGCDCPPRGASPTCTH